jgi:hypothetical protein
LVDSERIDVIVDFPLHASIRQLQVMLGHTGYYMNFIRGYAQITAPLEKLLNKEVEFQWNEECQNFLDTLKKKLVAMPILIFPDWKKEFHVHMDGSSIELGVVLA